MSVTENFVTEKMIANQAYIKELSSEEIVIMDDKNIVAGMASSKSLKNSSLPSTVTKGNIRMWAGQFSNANLSTAPFTVSDTGHVKMNDCEIYGFTKRKKLLLTSDNYEQYFTVDENTGGEWSYLLNLDKSGTFVEFGEDFNIDGNVWLPCFDTSRTDNTITFDEACQYIGQYVVIKNNSNIGDCWVYGVFNQEYNVDKPGTAIPGGSQIGWHAMIIAKCVPRIYYVDNTRFWVEIGWEYTYGKFDI